MNSANYLTCIRLVFRIAENS